jgi:hypothetical protein
VTTLDDRRIQRMRSAVMDVVDADIRRRGRRARIAVRTGVAACAVAVVAGLGTLIATTGGGSPSTAGGATSTTTDSNVAGAASGPARVHVPGARPQTSSGSDPAHSGSSASGSTTGSSGRDIISTGSARVVTATPLDTADDFISWVESNQGYVAGQSDSGVGATANLTLTVRVPDQEAAITRLRALGRVEQVQTNAQDVTTQTTDLDARIQEARISISRLETILSRTTSVRDVLTAENALTQRQQQLESMVLQRQRLGNQVALATLTVTFSGKPPAAPVAHRSGWFHRTVSRSAHAFGAGAKAVFAVIVFILPWAVVVGLVLLVWRLGARLTRRHA